METRKLNEIKIGERFRKVIGNLNSLKQSIRDIGLLHPIVIDNEGNLIAGQRRILAFRELGKDEIPVTIINLEKAIRGEHDENSIRKDFIPSEAVAIWQAMESYQGKRTDIVDKETKDILQPMSILPISENRREIAASVVNVGTRTLSKAKQVIEHGTPDLVKEMDRTGNVNKAYRAVKQKQDEAKIIQETPKLEAVGLFKTIGLINILQKPNGLTTLQALNTGLRWSI